MLINSGMRVTSLSARPVVPPKGDINRIRSAMPADFRMGRIFELSGKTVIMQKGLSTDVTDAVAQTLRSGAFILSSMPENNIYFLSHDADKTAEVELALRGRVIKFPEGCSAQDARKQVLYELADFLPQEDDGVLHILVTNPERGDLSGVKADVVLSLKKKVDPAGYCLHVAKNALSGKYRQEDIERIVSMIPGKAVEELRSDQLVSMIEMALVENASGPDGLKVVRRKDGSGFSSIETIFMKDAYFGVSHDIISVFANVGLEPFDMRFYSLGGENGKLFCVCRARFIGNETGAKKIEFDVRRLMEEDRSKRVSLASEGDRLWFSFVGLYNAMSRLAASMDDVGYDASEALNIMKKHGDIMRFVLSVLRKRCDESYREESQCQQTAGDDDVSNMYKAAAELPPDEARIMKFCIDFALSVRKTDYFDFNRLKEVSSFLMNADQLKDCLDRSASIRPEEILYIYRRSHGIEVHPIYAAERKTRTERYSDPGEIGRVQDATMSSMMGPYVRNVRQIAAARALEIMPAVTDMSDRELRIFESMRFIDEDDRECNILGILPNSSFSIAAGALFSRPQEDGLPHQEHTYMEDVARVLGMSPQSIDHVSIKFLGRGGLREVSTVKVHSGGVTNTFIAAVNRREVWDSEKGHAAEEFEALKATRGVTDLLPTPFGFTSVPLQNIKVGVLFKEFLMGLDSEQYFGVLSKEESKFQFFRAVGMAIGQLYGRTGMGSSDFKLPNMVFFRDAIRFCDICPLTDDMGMVMNGFIQLFGAVPDQYKTVLVEGIMGDSLSGREFMGRIRENMLYDNGDAWQSLSTWEDLNKIASAKGMLPEEYYRWSLV